MQPNTPLEMDTFNQLKTLMGDKFSIVIQGYLKCADEFVVQANTAINENNAQLLMEATHPLKSSSAQIGAMPVSNIAGTLEANPNKALSDNSDISIYTELLDQLNMTFTALKSTLNEQDLTS